MTGGKPGRPKVGPTEARIKELEMQNKRVTAQLQKLVSASGSAEARIKELEGLIVEFIPRLDGFSFGQDIVKRAKAALYDSPPRRKENP